MTARPLEPTNSRVLATLALLAWLGIAIITGATGQMTRLPSPGPQLLIIALAVLTVTATLRIPRLRALVDGADLRIIAAPHLLRLVGFVFLIYAARGELNPLFARNAGVGDIIAALLLLPLLFVGPPRTRVQRNLWLAWSVLGLADFAIVLGTARYVAAHYPGSLAALFQLPLAVVPLFAVPLLIASHLTIIRRLLQQPVAAP